MSAIPIPRQPNQKLLSLLAVYSSSIFSVAVIHEDFKKFSAFVFLLKNFLVSLMIFQHQHKSGRKWQIDGFITEMLLFVFLINCFIKFSNYYRYYFDTYFFSLDEYFSPPFRRGSSTRSCEIGDIWLKMYPDIARNIRVQ